MKRYVDPPVTEQVKKKKKKKADEKSSIKKSHGLTENAKVIMEHA